MHNKRFANLFSQFLTILILFLILPVGTSETPSHKLKLMPYPYKVVCGNLKFRLTDSFTVAVHNSDSQRVRRYATRFLRRLSGRTGLFFEQDYVKSQDNLSGVELLLRYDEKTKVELGMNESYRLEINQNGIEINSETDVGIMRGLETLLQLVDSDDKGYFFPTLTIQDKPRFPWRGLLLDTCRHFMPLEVIKRNIDGMAAVKMNVLHLHLSENQGFRVESKSFPKLHQKGSDGFYYTQRQIKEIISYASDRGMRVVPEFDIPGHATSWLVAYPEFASAPGPYEIERHWGVFDPTFNPTLEKTYEFFDRFFSEMSGLFPDEYFHIGGDENNGRQWSENPQIQSFMKSNGITDNHALQAYFNKRILKTLSKYNKKMIGWDEILQPDLPKDIVIHSWRGKESLADAAQKGFKGILSNGYYIDLVQPARFHYLNDPIPSNTVLTPEEQKLILGGEATMWGELVSPETVDSRIWPRTAAIAERFWSQGEIAEVEDMYRRLEAISRQLEEHGLTHKKNYHMMLRRLADSDEISSLKTLVDVIEPVKYYQRHVQEFQYSSYSPLTRVVDTASPDSTSARIFNRKVERFLKTKNENLAQELIQVLKKWAENHQKLEPVIRRSPVLMEIKMLSADLSKAAEIGLQSISRILSGRKIITAQVRELKAFIKRARSPRGETELVILPGIDKLLGASSNLLDLDTDWEFRRVGENKWYKANAPGLVHMDLFQNNLIKHPFYGTNEADLQWIENEDWEYRTSFGLDAEFFKNENAEIVFKGLDTYADVFLNGSLLFKANNMFRQWQVSCKKILKVGKNNLLIRFHSPLKVGLQKEKEMGFSLPGGMRVHTRKAAYHYGWDWAPRFATSGIWRPAYLKAWNAVKLRNLQIIQKKITNQAASLTAVFEIESSNTRQAYVSILRKGLESVLDKRKVTLQKGSTYVSLDFIIENPKLWWPNGLGEQHLYSLIGRVTVDKNVVDEVYERIGLRTIELIQEKDKAGTSFYIKVNNAPVFMKGANYVPQDSFLSRVDEERYRHLLQSAADANMNMLRVWGGGIYENDEFYDLCDEYGLLIWQDFMFACAMYPGSVDFLENVEREAVENVKRLRNHPSIALWCGNNEIKEGWYNWGWQDEYDMLTTKKIWDAYHRLFHNTLPSVIERYDPTRSYYSSSPKIGWGDEQSLKEGDSHYWGVWWGKEPFRKYEEKIGRFMSEFGFQSLPPLATIRSFTAKDDRNLESEVMKSHQKHPQGYQLIQIYMERDYRPPKNFESLIYLSHLLQAEGLKLAIESHRTAKPYCMGSLYWQLNDCWPAVSWSSIDYYGNWKALHYFAKKAFNDPMTVIKERDGHLQVYVVSDKLDAVDADLEMSLTTFDGKILWAKRLPITIEPDSNRVYFEISSQDFLAGVNKAKVVFSVFTRSEKKILHRNLYYFMPTKDLNLTKTTIDVEIKRCEGGYKIELKSDNHVKNLFLEITGIKGRFSDNYFDLLPCQKHTVSFVTKRKVTDLKKRLIMMSVVDTY